MAAWLWLFAATGFAFVMPVAVENAHYAPAPSLERRPFNWGVVIGWALWIFVLCFVLPLLLSRSRSRKRDGSPPAGVGSRVIRILGMLAVAALLIDVGTSDHWGWPVHAIDWTVAAAWLGLAAVRTRDLIRSRRTV